MLRSVNEFKSSKTLLDTLVSIGLMLTISVSFFLILAYRIDKAPDIFMDEIIYYRAAYNLATTGQLTWDINPILVHPPVQFLTQATFLHLTGLADHFYPFTGTYVVRLVNVFAAAVTIGILFRMVERMCNLRAALITSLILLMDPFVVRINRRNMLETMAEMWLVAGLYVFWNERDRLTWRSVLWIGSIFGLGILTKELVFFGYAVIPIFVILRGRWSDLKKVSSIAGVALFIWLLFPFWAWSLGQWDEFVANKAYNFDRLRGTVQVTGWNREGVSFLGALSVNLNQYGTSYALILLGVVATVLIFFTWHDERGRFIFAWSATTFVFFGYTIAFGTINDQFFYFLMVPIIVVIAVTATRWIDLLTGKFMPENLRSGTPGINDNSLLILHYPAHPVGPLRFLKIIDHYLIVVADWFAGKERWLVRQRTLANSLLIITITLGVALQSYNGYRWVKLYVIDADNSLFQLTEFIKQTLPPGTTINSMFDTGELTLDLMLPEYDFVSLRRPREIQAKDVEYAILSSKNLWGRYGKITPDYYEWVLANGDLIFHTYGNSFWDVAVYKLHIGGRQPG